MKQLMNALKTVHAVQWLAIAAAAATLLLLAIGGVKDAEPVSTGEEKRIERILSEIEGVKKAAVMISYDTDGNMQGAVVAATGEDEIKTILEIQSAVKTLTGLNLDQIEIMISDRRK